MKVVVIDNYDSFVFNLVRYIEEETDQQVLVMRNDSIDFEQLSKCDAILLSPGPGLPEEAGQLMEVINQFHSTHKLLGVCLGHQAIGQYFGHRLIKEKQPVHGKQDKINLVEKSPLFDGISNQMLVGRYHSWCIDRIDSSPLKATCQLENGQIMGIRHTLYDVEGVQFHPESILTPQGRQLIKNWIKN